MYLFLLSLLPILCLFCYFVSKEKISLLISGIGALLGVFVCMLCSILSFRHRIPAFSFSSNFSYYCINEYALPLIALYVLYFLISRDSIEVKVKLFLPLEAGFFAVYMPYVIITASSSSVSSFFELFLKPALFATLLLSCAACVFLIAKSANEKKIKGIVLYSVAFALFLFLPICLNTLWLLGVFLPFVYVASAVYILCGLCVSLFLVAVSRL